MNWSRNKPFKPGWYWWRNQVKGHAPTLVEVKVDEYWFLKSGAPAYFAEGSLLANPDEEWAEQIENPS
jgi:hypothetical protein